MENIHPPGGYFQRKEREKSPFIREMSGSGLMPSARFGLSGLSSYEVLIQVFRWDLLPKPVEAYLYHTTDSNQKH
jgi:hypothetical protein